MQDLWYLLILLSSFFAAGIIVFNQVVKLDSSLMTLYRGFGVFLILLPFSYLFSPIAAPTFYALCVFQGFIIGYFDNKIFAAAKIYGSRITSLVQPISIMFIFVVWFLVEPSSFFKLMQNPLRFLIVFIALSTISFCIFTLKRSEASKAALVYLLPTILCVIAIDVIGKKTMYIGRDNIYSAVFFYTLITSLVAGLCNLFYYIKKKNDISKIIEAKSLLTIALPIALMFISQGFLKSYSLHVVPNPAYVSAVLYTSPIWVLFINRYILKKEKADNSFVTKKRVVFALVISVIVLIIAS